MRNIIDIIEQVFSEEGDREYLGEAVTMSQHMLLTAREAEEVGADEQQIAAALLHDIGHFKNLIPSTALADGKDNFHEIAGAEFLAAHFPSAVVQPVRYHVAAKRYLCAVDRSYFEQLSDASVHTLGLQGGPMSQAEIEDFESLDHVESCVQVRKWDDRGKDPAKSHARFVDYQSMLENLVVT